MGGSTLARAGVLALLLTLLPGCGSTYSYVNVRSSIPGTQGLVKALMEMHSDLACKDADREHRSAQVYAVNGTTNNQGLIYRRGVVAQNDCQHD